MTNDSSILNTTVNETAGRSLIRIYDAHLTAWFAVNFILMTVAVTFLVLIIYAVAKGKKQEISASQTLILHLLCAELAICGGLYPAIQFTYYLPTFRFGTYSCDLFQFFYMLIVGAEQWTMFSLSLNRLLAIFAPLSYGRYVNKRSMLSTLGIAWTIPLIVTIMPAAKIGGQSAAMYIPWSTCVVRPSPSLETWALQAVNFVCMVIPLAGTILSYSVILLGSWKRYGSGRSVVDQRFVTHAEQMEHARQRKKLGMARMLFVSAFWYMLCYLPHTMIVSFGPQLYAKYPHLGLWTRTIYFMGFAGNPVMMRYMNQNA
ncbi:uncharacterized protein LOC129599324 [Paramacrobiotus metropolitanus]|uniref:uncharacterized protein LOC129599324 n=1 Tax=Paramacrobiotus metropolitanus TaxID=2943436 RepID=UPI002445EB64|nr:uncharacterized protein LOC129599324 [Paramacrobiotus metropolitanus]